MFSDYTVNEFHLIFDDPLVAGFPGCPNLIWVSKCFSVFFFLFCASALS